MALSRRIGIVIALGFSRNLTALPVTRDCSLSDFGRLIQKAMEITDSGTHRKTVPEYADSTGMDPKAAEDKFAATGTLKCKGSTSSANLVLKDDVIVTTGHALIDFKTCNRSSNPKDCTFIIKGQAPIKIASAKTGSKCPAKGHFESDWAVMKLEKPVVGIKPYKIKTMSSRDTIEPQKIVAVGDSSADFKRLNPKTKKMEYIKHVQDCSIRRIYYIYDPLNLATDCDSSYGSSGGAILSADLKEPTLVGIIAGGSTTKEEGEREVKTGKPVRKKFNDESWNTAAIGIIGPLYDALTEAAK